MYYISTIIIFWLGLLWYSQDLESDKYLDQLYKSHSLISCYQNSVIIFNIYVWQFVYFFISAL